MIRRLQKSDRDQLIKLFWEFNRYNKENLVSKDLQPFHEYKNPREAFAQGADDYINKEKFVVFVADIDGELVGYCSAKIIDKPDKVLNKEAAVEDWFVTDSFRGKKIGKDLFDTMAAEVKKRGCTHIRLDTFTTNKKAQDIYHKYGFIDNTIEMYKKI